MKSLVRLALVVLVVSMTTVALLRTATPAHANTWFPYPGITCGPSSDAYISVVSNAPGRILWEAAIWISGPYGSGQWAWPGGSFNAGGSWYYVFPSRYLNSYYLGPQYGASIVAQGPGCT